MISTVFRKVEPLNLDERCQLLNIIGSDIATISKVAKVCQKISRQLTKPCIAQGAEGGSGRLLELAGRQFLLFLDDSFLTKEPQAGDSLPKAAAGAQEPEIRQRPASKDYHSAAAAGAQKPESFRSLHCCRPEKHLPARSAGRRKGQSVKHARI